MALKDELYEWFEERRGTIIETEEEQRDQVDDLWEFLQEKLGPAQEKLLLDIQMLRDEKHQLLRKNGALTDELSRLQSRTDP